MSQTAFVPREARGYVPCGYSDDTWVDTRCVLLYTHRYLPHLDKRTTDGDIMAGRYVTEELAKLVEQSLKTDTAQAQARAKFSRKTQINLYDY
jgi:hypothetical protein